ncbi:MAG TPA: aminotransferase class I/II-fold pyridoxal phosphate-dependent enzyme [Candidatus Baltobacteraceae bacterium]|nr:aminotransferase class I/II-fold pyridoxal phosphate-dependent enzyme [Candidatus Baltobacteraceae bacterium]
MNSSTDAQTAQAEFLAAPHIEAIPLVTPFIGPEELMREGGHPSLLRLGANESMFGPSARAVAAMAAELPRISWYGDPESFDVREALALRHGCSIDEISVGAGIDDLMGLAVRAFIAPGGRALATRGTYPTFSYHVTGFGGALETVPYRQDGFVDVDALIERAKALRPGIVYLANPDNPSGTVLSAAQVERLFAALPRESLLFLDEAYADFVEGASAPASQIHPRLVRVRTFSKAYGMAGARIGYAIAAARNVRTFQKIRLHYGVNRNAQIGALAAFADTEFHRYVVREVAAGREEYYRLAQSLGRGALRSAANFVCIDFDTNDRATAVMNALLARGVFVRKPGAPPLDRYVRVSVGTAAERAEFGARLRAVLNDLHA